MPSHKYCGIDRSNMYKIINGKRNPTSREMVEAFASYMKLNPIEREALLEAYQMKVLGHDTYYRRRCVDQFVRLFSENKMISGKKNAMQDCFSIVVDRELLQDQRGKLTTGMQLHMLITSIFALEARKKGRSVIRMMAQPDHTFLMNSLLLKGVIRKDIRIEHIFCLNDSDRILDDNQDYNILCLQNIIPLFTDSSCEYLPFCYYDNIRSRHDRFALMSSMIVTSEYAIVFSGDGSYGMLLTDPESVGRLIRRFDSLKEETVLLAEKTDSLEKQLNCFEGMDFTHGSIGYVPESCLIPFVPGEFVQKYLRNEVLQDPQLMNNLSAYMRSMSGTAGQNRDIHLFSEEGIRRFLKTGTFSELPDSIYHPLRQEDRIFLIRRLIKAVEISNYHMIRSQSPLSDSSISLYVSMKNGYLLLPGLEHQRIFIQIRERTILQPFKDYLESIEEEHTEGKEETIRRLQLLIS